MRLFSRSPPSHRHEFDVDEPDVWIGQWGKIGVVGSGITPQHIAFQVVLRCKGCDERKMVVWRIRKMANIFQEVANLDGLTGTAPKWVDDLP